MDSFSKYENYNGYLESYYDSLMIPLIKEDICKTLNNTDPAYYREISFNYEDCNNCLKGIFKKGFLVIVKKGI